MCDTLSNRTEGLTMLGAEDVTCFIPTTDMARSRAFFEQTVGLEFVEDDGFALVFRTHNADLRIVRVKEFIPFPFTLLGWTVTDVEATVAGLVARGVEFERFEGMAQDTLGIWVSSGGAQVAWFKDPDGNLLSVGSR